MQLGPDCPRCGSPVPLRKAIALRGRPFPCRDCGVRLVAAKANSGLAAALFVVAAIALDQLEGHPPNKWGISATVLLLGCLIEYVMLRVRVTGGP